jgi:hypothetical protein
MSNQSRRRINGKCVEDSHAINNIEYNDWSGAQKNITVGPALEFIGAATSEQVITPGDQLFIFKSTTGIGYVTLSETTGVVAGVAPAADTFPVFGEAYTPISAANYKFIIGTADTFLYKLRDDSSEFRVNP